MERYAPKLLRPKDLVMVEVYIAHYQVQDEDDKNKASSSTSKYKAKSPGWENWRAHLELKAISLIATAPKEQNKISEDDTTELTI
jgi:hypothetical protein